MACSRSSGGLPRGDRGRSGAAGGVHTWRWRQRVGGTINWGIGVGVGAYETPVSNGISRLGFPKGFFLGGCIIFVVVVVVVVVVVRMMRPSKELRRSERGGSAEAEEWRRGAAFVSRNRRAGGAAARTKTNSSRASCGGGGGIVGAVAFGGGNFWHHHTPQSVLFAPSPTPSPPRRTRRPSTCQWGRTERIAAVSSSRGTEFAVRRTAIGQGNVSSRWVKCKRGVTRTRTCCTIGVVVVIGVITMCIATLLPDLSHCGGLFFPLFLLLRPLRDG